MPDEDRPTQAQVQQNTPEPAAPPVARTESRAPAQIENKNDKALTELKQHETKIAAAEAETVHLLAEIQASIQKLQGEMDVLEGRARAVVGEDEGQARLYLQRRQSTAEHMTGLETRLYELEQDIERLRTLKSGVQARILELTAVDQRDRLLRLEESVLKLR